VSRFGDFYENRITGERVVVLRGDEDTVPGESGFGHLTVAPRGALAGEHIHPRISERFMVISGTLGTRLDGVEGRLDAGEEATAEPGVAHDWWNAGEGFASVLVEVKGPDEQRQRFDAMFATIFGLANAGRTRASGMPGLLQLALLAREFRDVIVFTRPPRAIQAPLFAALTAVGRMRGLRAVYPEYLHVHGHTEPDPDVLALAGIELPRAVG
jgi:mannose-6-phosphate isomerase-like protein (cupin superfamily)